MSTLLYEPQVTRVLLAGRLADVAVRTPRGPFVTPVLYGVALDRLWFLIRRDTLKARALRRDPRVGLLVRNGDEAVALAGTAHLLPSDRPWEWLRSPLELTRAPAGGLSWALRNPSQLAGFLRDALPGLATCMPQNFVAVAVHPDALAVVSAGEVAWTHGPWPVIPTAAPDGLDAPVPGLPYGLDALVAEAGQVAVGVDSAAGPVVVPGTWRPGIRELQVPRGLLAASGAAAVAVTFDAALMVRPSEQRGVMLRGTATPMGDGLRLHVGRVTYWSGFETGTVELTAASAPAAG